MAFAPIYIMTIAAIAKSIGRGRTVPLELLQKTLATVTTIAVSTDPRVQVWIDPTSGVTVYPGTLGAFVKQISTSV